MLRPRFAPPCVGVVAFNVTGRRIASGAALPMLSVRGSMQETSPATSLARPLAANLVLLQVATGVLNLLPLAPIRMQLVHFQADLVWLSALLLTTWVAAVAFGGQSPFLDTRRCASVGS